MTKILPCRIYNTKDASSVIHYPSSTKHNTNPSADAAHHNEPAKRRYVPDVKYQEAVKKMKLNEIELRDRDSVLRGSKTNVMRAVFTHGCPCLWGFTNVRKLIGEWMNLLRDRAPCGLPPQYRVSLSKEVLHLGIITNALW